MYIFYNEDSKEPFHATSIFISLLIRIIYTYLYSTIKHIFLLQCDFVSNCLYNFLCVSLINNFVIQYK